MLMRALRLAVLIALVLGFAVDASFLDEALRTLPR
jgi:hypothetical protein